MTSQKTEATSTYIPIGTEWGWPLDNFHIQQNVKYGSTVENTNYDVRNLDVVLGGADKITCYGVGSHRIFHAGVDLYPASLNTEDLAVKAVANGQVVYRAYGTISFPGEIIIVRHNLQNGDLVYSIYMHLSINTVTVNVEDYVIKGQLLGYVLPTLHEGRFPEFHSDGDDTHLHFEIRTFQDATLTDMFPAECHVLGPAGVSYTYPNSPDSYGYLDPLTFIMERLPIDSYVEKVYLPLVTENPELCQDGRDLLLPPPYNRNSDFESPISYSAPWHEISNFVFLSPNNPPVTYPFVQNVFVLNGSQSVLLNNWGTPGCCGWTHIDEELLQSVHVPNNVILTTWTQLIQLRDIDPGDQFIIDLKDAETGHIAAHMEVIDENSGYLPYQTYQITYAISGSLANRDFSLSYSSISDDDTEETHLVLDSISFVTYCGSGQSLDEQIQVTRSSIPLP